MEATILLKEIAPSPNNARTVAPDSQDVLDLAQSIKAQGLLQAIVIRPKVHGKLKYEIVCGERRFKACESLGHKDIRTEIADMTDSEAKAAAATENLQRKDLSPLQAANAISILKTKKMNYKEIADMLGKTVGWVAKRANLTNLIPQWERIMEAPGQKYKGLNWGVAHFEMIARLSYDDQKCLLTSEVLHITTAKQLNSVIQDLFMHKIAKAPWSAKEIFLLEDETPIVSCDACMLRSSKDNTLFPELKPTDDRCMDTVCWNVKLRSTIEQKKANLECIGKPHILLDNNVNVGERTTLWDDKNDMKARADNAYNYAVTKKTDKKAVQALVIDGVGAGSVKWVRPEGWHEAEAEKKAKDNMPKTMLERRTALNRRRCLQFAKMLITLLKGEIVKPDKLKTPTNTDIMMLASAFGVEVSRDPKTWERYNKSKTKTVKEADIEVIKGVARVWLADLTQMLRGTPSKEYIINTCTVLGVNGEGNWHMVCTDIPEPKTWKYLNADGTKKELKVKK